MMTGADLYWITRLDGVRDYLHGLVGFSVFFLTIAALSICISCSCTEKWTRRRVVTVAALVAGGLLAVSLLQAAYVLVPSTKEMVAIMVVPRIVNSEPVQEIGVEAKALAREWLEELRPKGQESEP